MTEQPASDERFPRRLRLRGAAHYRRVYQRRSSASDGNLVVYACPNQLPYSRLGLSVSRKFGPAVRRNRWKRLVREAFRRSRSRLPAGYDLIVVARPGQCLQLESVRRALLRAAERAVRRDRRKES